MSNGINYDVATVENAMHCLMDMQELEETPNFGKLTYKPSSDVPNNRYNIEEYKDRIDSTFYTDMATSTLAYTTFFLKNNFGEEFDSDVFNYCYRYAVKGTHDLINDSEDEFGDFNGDEYIFENLDGVLDLFKLYAYYNEFELVTGDEKQDFIDSNLCYMKGSKGNYGIYSDFEIVFKKNININGTEVNFYYVSDKYFDMSEQMLQHDYNVKYLNDRMPSNVLNTIKSHYGNNDIDIVTISESCFGDGSSERPYRGNWAGLADIYTGNGVMIRENYFTDAIIHEIGHLFDRVNTINIGFGDIGLDYVDIGNLNLNLGIWDRLAETYAGDIEGLRKDAGLINAGYSEEKMKEYHYEFYAEAFQLYFYSPETRAALPGKVRDRIATEIEKYAS